MTPKETIQALRKVQKLDQLAQDRRVAEMEHRRDAVDSYLNDNLRVAVPEEKKKLLWRLSQRNKC